MYLCTYYLKIEMCREESQPENFIWIGIIYNHVTCVHEDFCTMQDLCGYTVYSITSKTAHTFIASIASHIPVGREKDSYLYFLFMLPIWSDNSCISLLEGCLSSRYTWSLYPNMDGHFHEAWNDTAHIMQKIWITSLSSDALAYAPK